MPLPKPSGPPVAETIAEDADALPTFRRATPEDALRLARATFLRGERLDMGTLAARLAVSRATLHRWFGPREQLIEHILAERAQEFLTWGRDQAVGEGTERLVNMLGMMLAATVEAKPVGAFIEREPKLALRMLIGENSAVNRAILDALIEESGEPPTPADAVNLRRRMDAVVHVAAALQWSSVAIGEPFEPRRAAGVLRAVLTADHIDAD